MDRWPYPKHWCPWCGRGFVHIKPLLLHKNACSQKPLEPKGAPQ